VFATPGGQPIAPNAIIDVLVKLGARLGIEIVAQGLESESDLDTARTAGCRYGQGYQVGRPAPPERLEAYLDSHIRQAPP
jgi:EAL domain-containing protein (putative c-di-GMP-specific phosphodiesterase class I)